MGTTDRPEIVCLCGSTRFADRHAITRWELERTGKAICLMINYVPNWYGIQQGWMKPDHLGEQSGDKKVLDELHLRKIDLADRVHVINVGGYIGESTQREIEYANSIGKRVTYLEPPHGECRRCAGCQGCEHHWLDNPHAGDDGQSEYVCKHCTAVGMACRHCFGNGDEPGIEGTPCLECGGEGVISEA